MKDFARFRHRFHEFGGWRLVRAYARMGVLCTGVCALARCAVGHRSLKEAYPAITRRIDRLLLRRYLPVLHSCVAGESCPPPGRESDARVPRIVWTAWLQGVSEAPPLVRACWASVSQALPDYEMRVVTAGNIGQWVTLPDDIVRKYRRGRIPQAMMADLVRLAVLERYGGVWVDASVLCTGFGNEQLRLRWAAIEQAPLTIFRYFQRGRRQAIGLSNWFIAARRHSPVVGAVLKMLLAYWHDFDCAVDYYVCHLFLGEALRAFPREREPMPRENSFHSLLLGQAFGRDFDAVAWDDLVTHVSFHKLGYRSVARAMANPKSYCAWVLVHYRPAQGRDLRWNSNEPVKSQ